MTTHIVNVPLTLPIGWIAAPGVQPRIAANGEHYFDLDSGHPRFSRYDGGSSHYEYIILIPDPSHIDTTTEEYRVEVYRQWLRGKVIEYREVNHRSWELVQITPGWQWSNREYRVAPDATDDIGPYYLDGAKKVYVPQ